MVLHLLLLMVLKHLMMFQMLVVMTLVRVWEWCEAITVNNAKQV
jgi:hypothetical protein